MFRDTAGKELYMMEKQMQGKQREIHRKRQVECCAKGDNIFKSPMSNLKKENSLGGDTKSKMGEQIGMTSTRVPFFFFWL